RVAGQFAWKFWLIGAGTALLGYFLFQSLDIIYLILTAFVISIAIENVIRFFQRRCSRGVSMLISYLLLLIFAFLGLLIVVPFLVQQFADLITVLIDRVSIIQQTIQHEGLETIITKAKIP
ncbi:AI-2E family transporter, partial [Patescibacteria group bacterium]|nr:AI-2E family transporter [Patescibacteria group bacterium]